MLGINHVLVEWAPQASLKEFGHLLGAAFEVNLAYSILLRLGNFSGKRICSWVDKEKLRIVPAMAETDNFDETKFTTALDGLEKRLIGTINVVNYAAIIWAAIAAVVVILVLCISPYCDKCEVSGSQAFWWEFALIGATPVGLAIFLISHIIALITMKLKSYQFDGMIRYSKKAQSDKINLVHTTLKAKLAAARNGE